HTCPGSKKQGPAHRPSPGGRPRSGPVPCPGGGRSEPSQMPYFFRRPARHEGFRALVATRATTRAATPLVMVLFLVRERMEQHVDAQRVAIGRKPVEKLR